MKVKILTTYPKLSLEVNNLYFSSDLHLNHESVIKYGRNFESVSDMNGHIISEINSKVGKEDLFVLLGDTMMVNKDYESFLSSINCENVIILVGNHCFDKYTEVLTDSGFKMFSELLEEDLVGSFDIKTKKVSFDKPINFLCERYSGDMFKIYNGFTEQVVTSNHSVVINDELKLAHSITKSDIVDIPLTGFKDNNDYAIDDNYLRLLVNIVCDSTMIDYRKYIGQKSTKRAIQFKLSKERKIENLKSILSSLNIPYTFSLATKGGVNVLQPFYIKIFGEYARDLFSKLQDKKEFPQFFKNLSKRQVDIVVDEISKTDGHVSNGSIMWTSTSKNDVDLIQEICITNDIKFSYHKYDNKSGFTNGKLQYRCKIDKDKGRKTVNMIDKFYYDDLVYCVQTCNQTVITRRNGKVAFSGNCNLGKLLSLQNNPKVKYVGYYVELIISGQIICCSHYPMFHWNYQDDGAFMLHGHLHSDESEILKYIHEYRCIDVGIDNFYKLFGVYSVFSYDVIKDLLIGRKIIGRHE